MNNGIMDAKMVKQNAYTTRSILGRKEQTFPQWLKKNYVFQDKIRTEKKLYILCLLLWNTEHQFKKYFVKESSISNFNGLFKN